MIVIFENSISGACPQGFNEFQYIAIGNNTAIEIVNAIMTELGTRVVSPTGCAISGISDEMARKEIT